MTAQIWPTHSYVRSSATVVDHFHAYRYEKSNNSNDFAWNVEIHHRHTGKYDFTSLELTIVDGEWKTSDEECMSNSLSAADCDDGMCVVWRGFYVGNARAINRGRPRFAVTSTAVKTPFSGQGRDRITGNGIPRLEYPRPEK